MQFPPTTLPEFVYFPQGWRDHTSIFAVEESLEKKRWINGRGIVDGATDKEMVGLTGDGSTIATLVRKKITWKQNKTKQNTSGSEQKTRSAGQASQEGERVREDSRDSLDTRDFLFSADGVKTKAGKISSQGFLSGWMRNRTEYAKMILDTPKKFPMTLRT